MTVTHELDLAALSWVRAAARDGRARAIRKRARISIPELAEKVGVAAATVTRWEHGSRTPTGEAARRYAAALLELRAVEES